MQANGLAGVNLVNGTEPFNGDLLGAITSQRRISLGG